MNNFLIRNYFSNGLKTKKLYELNYNKSKSSKIIIESQKYLIAKHQISRTFFVFSLGGLLSMVFSEFKYPIYSIKKNELISISFSTLNYILSLNSGIFIGISIFYGLKKVKSLNFSKQKLLFSLFFPFLSNVVGIIELISVDNKNEIALPLFAVS